MTETKKPTNEVLTTIEEAKPAGQALLGLETEKTDIDMTLDSLLAESSRYGVSLEPNPNSHCLKVKNTVNSWISKKTKPPLGITDPKLFESAGFFSTMIKPMLAHGPDSFKPSPENVSNFCSQLAAEQETRLVIYYALSKTLSPNRTGSPDAVIDLAELEMLKYYSELTATAKALSLPLKVIIMNEATIIPSDEILCISETSKKANHNIATEYLQTTGAGQGVLIRPLDRSIKEPLGADYPTLYAQKKSEAATLVFTHLTHKTPSAETKRIQVFLECTPDSGLNKLGIQEDLIRKLRENPDPAHLPEKACDYYTNLTAHVKAVMDLRSHAAEKATANGSAHNYPEYDARSRLYGGVTRSKNRWSFLPHPTRYQGETRNPMHGLAAYDGNRNFKGYITYAQAIKIGAEIMKLGNKPIGVLLPY